VARKQYDAQLEAIERLRHADPATAAEPLRKALRNRSNYLVAKAAGAAAALGLGGLIPDLLAALDRFYAEGSDPQCWAKNALVDALAELAHTDSAVYVRGLKHVQMEAVWGGKADAAGPLRARCAVALPACRELRDIDLLRHLVDALADPEKTVRAEAARAISRVNREEAALVVRTWALTGDPEPEVVGACLAAVLEIEGGAGIRFVERFLDEDRYRHAAAEAALVIGLLRSAEAFAVLKEKWAHERDPALRAALLTGIALTGLPDAASFLIGLVAEGSQRGADALEALGSARLTEDERARLKTAVEASGEARLRADYEKRFAR
jgi:aminopeptidase N